MTYASSDNSLLNYSSLGWRNNVVRKAYSGPTFHTWSLWCPDDRICRAEVALTISTATATDIPNALEAQSWAQHASASSPQDENNIVSTHSPHQPLSALKMLKCFDTCTVVSGACVRYLTSPWNMFIMVLGCSRAISGTVQAWRSNVYPVLDGLGLHQDPLQQMRQMPGLRRS